MNVYLYKDLKVEVFNVPRSDIDLVAYSKCYSVNTEDYLPAAQHAVRLYENGQIVNSCMLMATGGATGIYKNSSLLDDNHLLVCCCNTVFCLRLPDLALIWNKNLDLATCFQIFPLKEDYIVHGEVSITRIDKAGDIKWEFSGPDIFVSMTGSEEFVLEENLILLTDFEGNKYKLDFEGKLIS